jgi:hypothetical protein
MPGSRSKATKLGTLMKNSPRPRTFPLRRTTGAFSRSSGARFGNAGSGTVSLSAIAHFPSVRGGTGAVAGLSRSARSSPARPSFDYTETFVPFFRAADLAERRDYSRHVVLSSQPQGSWSSWKWSTWSRLLRRVLEGWRFRPPTDDVEFAASRGALAGSATAAAAGSTRSAAGFRPLLARRAEDC